MNEPREEVSQTVFKDEPRQAVEGQPQTENKTSSGLDQNIASLLCYLFGFISGIIFILIEKDHRVVRFHAMQSIFFTAAVFILNIILIAIPFLGWVISILIWPIVMIIWIVLMVKAYQGQALRLPIIAQLAEKQVQ